MGGPRLRTTVPETFADGRWSEIFFRSSECCPICPLAIAATSTRTTDTGQSRIVALLVIVAFVVPRRCDPMVDGHV
jgi:hypothetical protein